MNLPLATPAHARDCRSREADAFETQHVPRSRSPRFLFEERSKRLGVTSRPVRPVPPVEMMTSIPEDSIHSLTRVRISVASSRTSVRSQHDARRGR